MVKNRESKIDPRQLVPILCTILLFILVTLTDAELEINLTAQLDKSVVPPTEFVTVWGNASYKSNGTIVSNGNVSIYINNTKIRLTKFSDLSSNKNISLNNVVFQNTTLIWIPRNSLINSASLNISCSRNNSNAPCPYYVLIDIGSKGDLDLAVGNYGSQNFIYENNGTSLINNTIWLDNTTNYTLSIAFGDIDNDNDLELAVGNSGNPNFIYENNGTSLTTNIIWTDNRNDNTYAIAFGDVDNDGDLDLAVGNDGSQNYIYENNGTALTNNTIWSDSRNDNTYAIVFADIDNDDDLDLAVGNYGSQNYIYENNGTALTNNTIWTDNRNDDTFTIAFGDVDNDGDLDLAVGNDGSQNFIYENNGTSITNNTIWSDNTDNYTLSLAFGDVDNDNDLDLAVGNADPNFIYENNGTSLTTNIIWTDNRNDQTLSLAFGDVDNDNDLDLAVGNYGSQNYIYENNGTSITNNTIWTDNRNDNTFSLSFGDVDDHIWMYDGVLSPKKKKIDIENSLKYYVDNYCQINSEDCLVPIKAGCLSPGNISLNALDIAYSTRTNNTGDYKIEFLSPDTYGEYEIKVVVTDSTGKTGENITNLTVYNSPPEINLTEPLNATYSYRDNLPLTFAVSDKDGVSACWYSLDDGGNISIPNCENTTFSVSSAGSHRIDLFANDTLCLINSTFRNFFIDETTPSITLNYPKNGSNVSSQLDFNISVSDFTGISIVSLWGNWFGFWNLSDSNTSGKNNFDYIFSKELNAGDYIYNSEACDSAIPPNCGFAESNFTFTVGGCKFFNYW